MLDFRMETFLKVCEYMNFTHAGEALNLTQPAVSQHIKYLEKNMTLPYLSVTKNVFCSRPQGKFYAPP